MNWILEKKYILLLGIIIIASFLRLYNITGLPVGFYADEAMYANNGVYAWEQKDFRVFYPENFGREGLWSNIIGFFIKIWGNEPWVPRSIAAVMGILTVLGLYFFTKELFRSLRNTKLYENTKFEIPEIIALLSSFFIATSFWHILFSRIGFRAIMAPLFLVWALYFLLRSYHQIQKKKLPKSYIISALLGGLFFGLGFHTYIAFRAMPLLIAIMFLLYFINNKEWDIRKNLFKATLIFTVIAFLIFLPLGLYFVSHPGDFMGRTSSISIFNSPTPLKDFTINTVKTLGMFNIVGDFNVRHNYPARPEIFWPVGILFLIGIAYSIKHFAKSPIIILISWFLIAFLPTIISNEGLPHALRSLLLIPPVFILAGLGGARLYEYLSKRYEFNLKRRKLLLGGLVLMIPLLVLEAYITYFISWGTHPNLGKSFDKNYVDIGRYLNTLPQATPKYVVTEMAINDDFRLMPVAIQPLLFITNTLTAEDRKKQNLFYVLPSARASIPAGSEIVELP